MFTVMTYNVGNGLAAASSLVQYLRTAPADLVGMQELTSSQAHAVSEHLAGIYPFRRFFGSGIAGKGVLSRFPLTAVQPLALLPDRPDLYVEADVDRLPLRVLITHLPPPRLSAFGRRTTLAPSDHIAALAHLATTHAPAVLMGDFNMLARSAGHALLTTAGLRDAFQASGTGRGFTLPLRVGHSDLLNRALGWPLVPCLRVDYIWLTSRLEVLDCWTERGGGSDHRPVLARLQLTPAGAA